VVRAYDPVAMEHAARLLNDVSMCSSPYEVAKGSDGLVIVTEWNEFKQLDLPRLKDSMRRPVIVDGRNIYDPDEMQALGFEYRGFGRGYDGANSSIAA
jgi:UDPglucose 6-dehydrogenase